MPLLHLGLGLLVEPLELLVELAAVLGDLQHPEQRLRDDLRLAVLRRVAEPAAAAIIPNLFVKLPLEFPEELRFAMFNLLVDNSKLMFFFN